MNKKAYTFNLVRTGVNSFNTRLALNKIPLKEGEYTICVEFFIPEVDTNWFLNPSTPNPVDTLTYHTKHFYSHSPKYSRTIIHTHKYKDNDNTIYFDISNTGYDGSSPLEKAALIIYGVKGYQTDVDGAVYDQAFVIEDGGDFTLQTNLDSFFSFGQQCDLLQVVEVFLGYRWLRDIFQNHFSFCFFGILFFSCFDL